MPALLTLTEKIAHIERVQSFLFWWKIPYKLTGLKTHKERIAHFLVCNLFFFFLLGKLEDDEVCIKSLHTLRVCILFFGGNFSYAYLLKGVNWDMDRTVF